MRSLRRGVATAAAGAMVIALLPSGIAAAAPRGSEDVCPAPGGNYTAFTDIAGNTHEENIECMAGYGIARGTTTTTYNPTGDVRRDSMATFIVNFVEAATGEELEVPDEDQFGDTDASPHEENINKLAHAGLVSGTAANTYSPAQPVARDQMGTFIANAIDYADDGEVNGSIPPANTDNPFSDLSVSNTHYSNILRLEGVGVVGGVTATEYRPLQSVTRAQMATFIMQGADYLESEGFWLQEPVTPPVSNQDFTVTPGEAAENVNSTSAATNEGRRTYTVGGLNDARTYSIALIPADQVNDNDGTVTFTSASPYSAAQGVSIESVQGQPGPGAQAAPGAGVTQVNSVSPLNGAITFAIDSVRTASVVPVVWTDDATSPASTPNALDLAANGEPRDSFGIGGQKTWLPAQQASFAAPVDGTVSFLDRDGNRFGTQPVAANGDYVLGSTDRIYTYDANDTFRIEGVPATLAAFEAALSRGDNVRVGPYTTDSGLPSTFDIIADRPAAPGLAANVTGGNNVTLTITPTAPSTADRYDAFVIQRRAAAGTDADFATIATATTDADPNTAGFQYRDQGVAAGDYVYRAAGVIDGDTGAWSTNTPVTTTTPAPDTAAPVSEYAAVITDTGFQNEANAGDVWRVIFDEAVTVAGNAALRVADGGAQYTVTNGGNATFSLNTTATQIGGESYAAGRVLTVTLTGDVTPVGTATLPATYPLEIVNQQGIADLAGNAWALGGDTTLDRDLATPAIQTAVADAGADTVTLTYNTGVDCADVAGVRAQFSYAGATAATPTAITCNGTTTVVLGFDDVTGVGNVTYTQSANEDLRIRGLNGRAAQSPQTMLATI